MVNLPRPRPAQQRILRYREGYLGVSAVPGSGKTWTLSRLAADLIREGRVQDDEEILIVTLVNSAVDNFRNKINGFVQDMGLLPQTGYRVRTLHGLANDIVGERPDLVGLSDTVSILDEREADQILTDLSLIWLRTHGELLEPYLDPADASRFHPEIEVMVATELPDTTPFAIFAFEASRPGATATDDRLGAHGRACSAVGVLPASTARLLLAR